MLLDKPLNVENTDYFPMIYNPKNGTWETKYAPGSHDFQIIEALIKNFHREHGPRLDKLLARVNKEFNEIIALRFLEYWYFIHEGRFWGVAKELPLHTRQKLSSIADQKLLWAMAYQLRMP